MLLACSSHSSNEEVQTRLITVITLLSGTQRAAVMDARAFEPVLTSQVCSAL